MRILNISTDDQTYINIYTSAITSDSNGELINTSATICQSLRVAIEPTSIRRIDSDTGTEYEINKMIFADSRSLTVGSLSNGDLITDGSNNWRIDEIMDWKTHIELAIRDF